MSRKHFNPFGECFDDIEKLEQLDSGFDESGNKLCDDCGLPVFWLQTKEGWRLFEHNPNGLDKRHVCLARLDNEISDLGVNINLPIPNFKKGEPPCSK